MSAGEWEEEVTHTVLGNGIRVGRVLCWHSEGLEASPEHLTFGV